MVSHSTICRPRCRNDPCSRTIAAKWDQVFRSQELSLHSANSAAAAPVATERAEAASRSHEADELARTAGVLLDTVQGEINPKFKNSAFMGLMRQLRDGEVVVDGNEFVQRDEAARAQVSTDAKGKGRAADAPVPTGNSMQLPTMQRPFVGVSNQGMANSDQTGAESILVSEDPNDAYFREENEAYIAMAAAAMSNSQRAEVKPNAQAAEWDNLQQDWEAFEATATGIKPLTSYQFQSNNPYLHGEASRTRNHVTHGGIPATLYEVCASRVQGTLSSRWR